MWGRVGIRKGGGECKFKRCGWRRMDDEELNGDED